MAGATVGVICAILFGYIQFGSRAPRWNRLKAGDVGDGEAIQMAKRHGDQSLLMHFFLSPHFNMPTDVI